MKKLFFISVLLFIGGQLSAQWQLIPGTNTAQVLQMEKSGNYLFVARNDVDTAFIRIDLSNFSSTIMHNNFGSPFTMYGWKQMAAMGEDIFYTDSDTLYGSHNYGNSWAPLPVGTQSGMYFLAGNDTLFLGIFRRLYISGTSGYSFSNLYYEGYYTNTTLNPLLIKDSEIYFVEEAGLLKQNIHNLFSTVILDPTPNLFYNMDFSVDTLIATTSTSIYHSIDTGFTWTLINSLPFGNNFIADIYVEDTMMFAATTNHGMQLSTNNGRSFYSINEGLSPTASMKKIVADSLYLYVSTSYGIYRRFKSDFVIRNISGHVFYDANNNLIADSSESAMVNQSLKLNAHNDFYLTDSAGNYNITFAGIADTLKYESPHANYIPVPSSYFSTLPVQTGDFAIQIDSLVKSFDVNITPLTNSRPGQNTTFSIDCHNYGSGHQQIQLIVKPDSLLTPVYLSDSSAVVTTDSLTWSLSLLPFEHKNLSISCSLPADTSLVGDTLILTGMVFPFANDLFPSDNFDTLLQRVTASFDPNDKTVSPSGDIHPPFINSQEYLSYYIRFQNTGTDTAFVITVSDQLSPYLDLGSFEFIGSSHPCSITLDTTRLLSFHFNNILLVDSATNESGSHGYVRFKIRPKSDIPIGSTINNSAAIYFDLNSPVITNTVSTNYNLVVPDFVNQNYEQSGFIVYPNPFDKELFIPISRGMKVEVFNASGQRMHVPCTTDNELIRLNMSALSEGIYFIRIYNESFTSTRQVIKSGK